MSQIYKCDICGRTSSEVRIEHYKMKKEVYSWHEIWWQRLDVCETCIEEIRNRVKRGKRSE